MTTEHSMDTIRTQYIEARAAELAFADTIGQVQQAIQNLQQKAQSLTNASAKAEGACKAFRTVAESLELDWSDEALGDDLDVVLKKTTTAIMQQTGFMAPPKGPPEGGVVATRSRHGVPPSALDAASGEPDPSLTVGEAPEGAHEKAPEPSEPPEVPQGVPSGEPIPGGDEEPPKRPRLVRKDGGRISTVTERARAAMDRVKNPTPGEIGRAEGMIDESGRRIPVSEQIVVDDVPPEPGDGDREQGDKPIRERALD